MLDYLADRTKFKMSTCNKTYNGLIGWSFEMPNASYYQRNAAFKIILPRKTGINLSLYNPGVHDVQ